VVTGDSDGRARTARRTVTGSDNVARFLLGLMTRYGIDPASAGRLVLVNGDLGMVFAGDESVGLDRRVVTFAIRDGAVAAVYDVVNPDKLTRVR
jgi:RNA polymerase sigma-70 factor (ECF subfamily)